MTRNHPTPGIQGSSPDLPLMILVMVDFYIEKVMMKRNPFGGYPK